MTLLPVLKKYNFIILLFLAAVSLFGITFWIGFFICDDAWISFRYARNLALSGELVFNSGEKVEGYTNFLWTITLSFFSFLRLRLDIVAHFMTFISSVAVLAAVGKTLQKSFNTPFYLVFFAVFSCLFNGTFAFWTTGGLEGMAFSAFLLWGIYYSLELPDSRKWVFMYTTMWSGCMLTRPEGIALAAVSGLYVFISALLRKYRHLPTHLIYIFSAGSILGAIFLSHSIFKFFYYGSIIPNTWYAKIYGVPPDFLFKHGLKYVQSFFVYYWVFAFLPVLFVLLFKPGKNSLNALLLLILSGGLILHTILSGGDFMAMHRMMLPVWPMLVILVFAAFAHLVDLLKEKLRYSFIFAAIIGLLFASIQFSRSFSTLHNQKKSEKTWFGMESVAGMKNFVNDRVLIGKKLKKIANTGGQKVIIAVGGAGAISYFSDGKIIDSFGLMDPKTARKKVKVGNFYKPGHLKQAPWNYIASLSPELVCTPGIATMGKSPPSKKHRQRIQNYWKNYSYFCIRGNYSKDDRGRARNSYCCLIRNDFQKNIPRIK